jgi:DNA polymerase delta subunit 2
LGVGGQTVDDIFKYLPSSSRLGMARRTLEWRHIAPTAPDTLCELTRFQQSAQGVEAAADKVGIYPFPDADPFIIHHRPHVYVIGNQPEFQTTLVGGKSLSSLLEFAHCTLLSLTRPRPPSSPGSNA